MTPLYLSLALPVPWIVLKFMNFHGDPVLISVLTGMAILGAAFILSWAAEVFQMDVSQALALTLLALIAILPEYAVDAVFAYEAGRDPEIAKLGYAVANMTGANRLLVGLGWSMIVLFAWVRLRQAAVALERSQALEMSILLAASLYGLTIPFKGELNYLDVAILVPLFLLYGWMASRAPAEEPELAGPAARIGSLSTRMRRTTMGIMFLFAAFVIFISAEPFAHGLVDTGKTLGIDEFLLVQWLAPLASEAPEFTVALLFVARGQSVAGLRTLVSSLVNQWTLLIGTLVIVFSIGAGEMRGMPLVARQETEIWLTAAASVYAILLIADFSMTKWEALGIFVPFLLQLVLPAEYRVYFIYAYTIASVVLLLDPNRRRAIARWPEYIRESIKKPPDERMGEPPAEAREEMTRR